MTEINENILYALKNYGPLVPSAAYQESDADLLRRKIPDPLVDLMGIYGDVGFHGGLFNICNPSKMRGISALVFRDDKEFDHNTCHVIGYTAFGVLYFWSDNFYNFQVELPLNTVYCRALTRSDNWPPKASKEHIASAMIPDREEADFLDVDGEPMFDRCQEMHGPLEPGECYGFFPALAVAGAFGPAQRVENIRRVKAKEHFAILAQLDTFYLMELSDGDVRPVRPIGG